MAPRLAVVVGKSGQFKTTTMQEGVQKSGRRFRREYRIEEGGSGGSIEKGKELQKGVQKRGRRFRREYRKGEGASGGSTEKGRSFRRE